MRYVALIPAAILVAVLAVVLTGQPFSNDADNSAANRDLSLEPRGGTSPPLLAVPEGLVTSGLTARSAQADSARQAADPAANDGEARLSADAVVAEQELAAVESSLADHSDQPQTRETTGGNDGSSQSRATAAPQACLPPECVDRSRLPRIRRIPGVNRRCR